MRKSGKGITSIEKLLSGNAIYALQLLTRPIAFQAELVARDADMTSLQEQADHLQSQLQASNGQLQDARGAEEASLERMRREHAAELAAVKAC